MEKISKTVEENFMSPSNVGTIKNPDFEAEVKSGFCGDTIKFQFKVKDDIITDVKFRCFGCWAAIAAGSITTKMIKGKTVKEALTLTNEKIIESLGGLPENKKQCSLLSEQAIHKAFSNY